MALFHAVVKRFGASADYIRGMVTYYCRTIEEALRRAKTAGKQPGCFYGGITLRSGRRGFAIYKDGKVVEQYTSLKDKREGC